MRVKDLYKLTRRWEPQPGQQQRLCIARTIAVSRRSF